MGSTQHDLNVRAAMRGTVAKDLANTGKVGEKAGKSIAAGFIKAQIAIGTVKTLARATVRLLKSITTESVAHLDKIAKESRKIGVSTKFLSEMQFVADRSGASFEAMTRGIRNVSRNLRDLAQGSTTMVSAFTDLGFTPSEQAALQTLPVEDAFDRIVVKLGEVDKETERVALSMKALGMRAGPELLPMVDAGIRKIREMRKEAEKFGLSLSEADAKAAEAAADAVTDFEVSIEGLKRAIAVDLMPELTAGLKMVSEFVAKNRDQIAETIGSLVKSIGGMIIRALKAVSIGIAQLLDKLEGPGIAERAATPFFEVVWNWGMKPVDRLLGTRTFTGKGDSQGSRERAVRQAWAAMEAELKKARASLGGGGGGGPSKPPVPRSRSDIDLSKLPPHIARQFGATDPIQDYLDWRDRKERRKTAAQDYLEERRNKFRGALTETFAAMDRMKAQQPRGFFDAFLYGQKSGEEVVGGARQTVEAMKEITSPENLGVFAVERLTDGFTDLFDAIIFGSQDAGEAFKAFARDLMREISRLATQRLLLELLDAIIPGAGDTTSSASKGGVKQAQHGGVRYSRTRRGGVEFGDVPEVFIPLSKLRLGVRGGGHDGQAEGGGVTTHITVNAGAGADGNEIGRLVAAHVDRALLRHRGLRASIRRAAGGLA